MHIPYIEESIVQAAVVGYPKPSFIGKIWQLIRFCVVTGAIFSVSFFVLNFGAYKQILVDFINPSAQVEAKNVLENASGEGSKTVDPSLLLPVLPDTKDVKKSFAWVDVQIVPTDNRLVIPTIGKSVPLVDMSVENVAGENWSVLEKQIQEGLRGGVVHYPGTAKPGQFGNVFMTGHSSYYPWDKGKFKDVFAQLGKLQIGDKYYVYYNQKKYVYQITKKYEVQPSNVNVLKQPADKKTSTLMTCTPVGTTLRRLIIKAEQV